MTSSKDATNTSETATKEATTSRTIKTKRVERQSQTAEKHGMMLSMESRSDEY